MRLVWGTVSAVLADHGDAQYLDARLDTAEVRKALAYRHLGGACAAGDRILVNTTAQDMGLGTGGVDLVVARVGAGTAAEGVAYAEPSGGHIMKLRYTPLQRDVLAAEEEGSPHRDALVAADSVEGLPVVCCGLHSQVPLVAGAVKEAASSARVAYVMTDEATLAVAMSDSVRACRKARLLDTVITCGQAFGGEIETVNTYTGLLVAAHVADADVAIVAIGPGIAGTGTTFGHGGIGQGVALNAACTLGGRAIAALRISFADERPRHAGVSHHSLTALTRVALAPCEVALPTLEASRQREVETALERAGVWARHTRMDSDRVEGDLPQAGGAELSTMGRGPDEDPAFFAAAAAAGDVAAGSL